MKSRGKEAKFTTAQSTGMPKRTPDLFSMPINAWLKNSSAGILVTNEKYRCIWINDILRSHIGDIIPHNASYSQMIATLAPMLAEPAAFHKQLKILRRDKKPWFGWEIPFADGQFREVTHLPIFHGETFMGSIWQIVDITRRRSVMEEIRFNEEKFRVILNNLNAAMCETDLEGNITQVYESFCRLSGYREDELIGRNLTEIFVPADNRNFAHALRKRRMDTNQPLLYDLEVVLKDGSKRWVLCSSANVYDRKGNITGGAAVHMDITRQKMLQQDLENARHAAEEARQAQKEFLASMSHEIRTPLNAIIGMAHLLEETHLDAQQREYINLLKHSSGILLGIVSDILDISRIEAGELRVNPREFHLRELIQSLRHTFELKLGRKPIKITAEVDPAINTWLIGDDMLLNQILLNLLGNAEKFTTEGQIAVRVYQESWQNNKVWISFRVCDTGIGIKKDKLELIFQNYKQAEGDIREKYGGTGLGLAIAKQLVELQGGNIAIEEMPGFQTVFCFNMPYMDTGKPLAAGKRKPGRIPRNQTFENASLLVVEDNQMNLRYIMSLLQKYKINYCVATNGPDASWFLESKHFDLILMDIRIPGMNGLELAQRIRADEAMPNVATPVIATTAVALESTAAMARAAGITDILTKPYTPDQLLQLFHKYLNEDETELIMEEVQNISGYDFSPDLNVQFLNGLYENNISYAADLFEIFLRIIKDELGKIRELLDNDDWSNMKFSLHKLKPNFAMVGLTWITENVQVLESLLNEKDINKADIENRYNEIVTSLEKYYPVVNAEYEKMRKYIEVNGL
ncbi:PAS domain-containing hybrid sensor histidine kinase/response regulator [Chitinophaga sp. Cy-1792]|uniref:PAS domain-containing hybrid sensor histidine kinase/response regulator n=1 Tax=Chitinophaga sp. Cy-1792 TaxID=2608339 RepID=UPI001423D256|nr:PAS domain-containing hybrid sensor histidine kinase/response regulator [Chitinophaga sp. Cy-1792]NIG57631.1 PAS domain S-box protein [Chitinophaga sp. Cy-1792]